MSDRLYVPPVPIPVESPELVRARARSRTRALGALFAAVLVGIGVRGATLCLSPDPQTIRQASVQRWGQVTIRERRGEVLDREGRRLATSLDTPSVAVDPMSVREEDRVGLARDLARILELDEHEMLEKLSRESRYQRLKSKVHPAVARAIAELDHPAVWTHRDARRYYPEGQLASQILGFVDSKGVGRGGLEKAMDPYLDGGQLVVQRRRDRRGLGVDAEEAEHRPDAGMTVHTTLDRSIQRAAERALDGVVERHAPKAAFAVVIDVDTGDILALANRPTFNPNALDTDPAPRRNHAVQDAIEPGSVMKPFTIAAAVEEGLIDEMSPVDCEGGAYYIGRTRIRDDHPHGVVTATEVLKYSSNIGSAKQALAIGADRFIDYFEAFGFGEPTGIELPGERSGALRNPAKIRPIELATTSYGQGMTVTGLQLAMATASLANDGKLMKPRLVSEITDADGLTAWTMKPTVVRQAVSAETAHKLARMMVSVTEQGGTATRARVEGYKVAGKTGTAEKVENGTYGAGRIGSFMGFLPADRPEVAIVVTVDEPTQGSRYGGIVAAPAFAEIGAEAMRVLGVEPDPPEETEEAERLAEVPVTDTLADDGLVLTRDGDGWELPDLRGRPVREVLASLQASGLKVALEGSGMAVAQSPAPGTPIREGELVAVVFQ
ncbi:MAG: PASTA domain-containing protein [Deltaproteobacteria bacterium]|nr:MAG: PASTA domain-containing protein [Deltaproteobacteria bacterium]